MKHEDDEEVMYSYSSSRNITFRGEDSLGYTWGEWRHLSQKERDQAIDEAVWDLVDIYVDEEDEDE